jgi:hypothetical protein
MRLDEGLAGAVPLTAQGLTGRIELTSAEIRIIKDSAFGHIVDLLWFAHGVAEKRIPLSEVTSIEIVRPLLFPEIFRVTYAGSPPQTGHYRQDALAENALIMNLFDNRAFYAIRERVSRRTATAGALGAVAAAVPPPRL